MWYVTVYLFLSLPPLLLGHIFKLFLFGFCRVSNADNNLFVVLINIVWVFWISFKLCRVSFNSASSLQFSSFTLLIAAWFDNTCALNVQLALLQSIGNSQTESFPLFHHSSSLLFPAPLFLSLWPIRQRLHCKTSHISLLIGTVVIPYSENNFLNTQWCFNCSVVSSAEFRIKAALSDERSKDGSPQTFGREMEYRI